jgi:hypothetical protein
MTRRKAKRKPWTKAAERELFNGVGISGLAWFKDRCGGRSTAAVYHKLRREFGPGGLTRGAYTLYELERRTGYSETHIRRAGSALNQKWKRLGPRGAHLITEEQMDEIVTWLGHDFWSKTHRLYGCLWCATDKRAHRSVGLCVRCYHRHRRACIKRGLPVTVTSQKDLMRGMAIGRDNSRAHGRFLEKGASRLAAGLALSEEYLDWLAMLAP